MTVRQANAEWKGDLKSGKGELATESGAFQGAYSFQSRFEEGSGTNPEELIGAAHAGCFSMALSNMLAQAGHTPESVKTSARVHLEVGDDGPSVPRIELVTEAVVPGLDNDAFQKHAEAAKTGCPISKLLGPGTAITLNATLK